MATFNLYNNQADNFAATLISTPSGINVVGQSAVYTGALGAASTFDFLSFGTTIVPQRGILLTSGNGTPPQKNTQPGFGKANNTPGDAQLSQIVTDAFPGDSLTFDANAIAFKIKVDKGIKSVIFDVVFGSEEFPNYVNNFVDIAAIFVNGKNAAFFGGNSANPLSVLDANRNYFQDNTKKGLAIEYNAISKKLTVIAPVHEGINDIKIAIADTKDVWLDSGIFVSDMRGSTRTLSGILNELLGTDGKDKLKAEPDIDNILFGGPGKDKLWVSTGFDILYGDDEDGPVVAKGWTRSRQARPSRTRSSSRSWNTSRPASTRPTSSPISTRRT